MQRRRDDRHCIDGGHAPPKHFVQGQPRGFVDPGGRGRFPHQHQGDGGLGTLRPQRTHPQPKALGGGVRGVFFQTPYLHVKGVARGGGAGHRAAQNVAGTPWTSFGVGDGAQNVAAPSSATSFGGWWFGGHFFELGMATMGWISDRGKEPWGQMGGNGWRLPEERGRTVALWVQVLMVGLFGGTVVWMNLFWSVAVVCDELKTCFAASS
jgi:hypothetical protein